MGMSSAAFFRASRASWFSTVFLLILGITCIATAADLSAPRQGIVENVPVEEPYNGCLLVREGAGGNSKILGYVPNGTTVQIEATDGAWYKISSPKTGYVYSSFVRITETVPIDAANRDKALSLEEIVDNSDPWTRDKNLAERQKLLEDNLKAAPPELPEKP